MNCCSLEKRKLIEEIGLHFEKNQQLSPLASRIYAMMILSPADGHTFDEILSTTEASKSSVSTQLNLLLQLKKVEYFTKTGDRKRYFRANKMYLKSNLEDYYESISEEINLIEKVIHFNTTHNTEKFQKNGDVALIFKEYLMVQKENIKNAIKKISSLKKTNS